MITTQLVWYWLHLLGVIVWAGGFFYLVLAFIPAMNAGPAGPERSAVIQQAVARFRRVSWIAIGLLTVTGILNFIERVSIAQAQGAPATQLLPTGYLHALGLKLVIFIGLVVHHAVRLLEPRELADGRVGLKSTTVVVVSITLFVVAALLGLTLLTM